MEQTVMNALFNNAALLLVLSVIFEISYLLPSKYHRLKPSINGILIAMVCAAIMSIPFKLQTGVVFDTRSILISVTALIFGAVPTVITIATATVIRLIMGGIGAIPGIAVILTSAILGLIWRRWVYPKSTKRRWLSIYAMSVCVHLAMLGCMFLLPSPDNLNIIRAITMPVMLIYPIASVVLSLLLIRQRELWDGKEKLLKSEEKYRKIADNISDVVWTTDLNLKTTYISPSIERLMGENIQTHLNRTLEEKFPPDSIKKIRTLLSDELEKENDPNCDKNRSRVIELEHYRADGTTIWFAMNISIMRDEQGKPIGFQGVSRDITERKKIENQLKQNNHDLLESQRIAHLGTWRLDLMTNQVIWSEELYKMYGFDPTIPPPPYTEHMKLFTPESWQRLSTSLENTRTTGIPYELELETVTKDGINGWMWVRGEAEKDVEGNIVSLWGAAQDITEFKNIKSEVLLSEERFRIAQEISPDGFTILHPLRNELGEIIDFAFVYENKAIALINQTDHQQIVGKRLLELFPTHSGTSVYEAYIQVANTGTPQIIENVYVGEVISRPTWLRLVIVSMGEDIAIHAQDITERKQANQEQLFWQDMLRYVLENSFSSVVVMDKEMNYMFASKNFLKNFRITENDISRMNHYKLFPNLPYAFNSAHERVLAGETVHSEEEVFHHADGSSDYFRYLLRPWYQMNGDVGGIVLYIEFITERKQREQEKIENLMKYRQQQKLESIGTLASGVAHEINNPIMGIINYAQLILDDNNGTEKNEYAKEIISEALRISDITKDLLFYARQQKQEHSLANINDIILKTLSLVRNMLYKDQIDVRLNLNDDLPQLKCRSQQIQQILMNLLTNAKDALNDRYPGGDPDKAILISNHLFNEGGRRWIRVIVEDHGNGISPEVQQRVFDPFFSTKSRDVGTGLGLPISYGIAKDHHGRLFFETETGHHTRFILELPVDNGWDIKEDK
jgi:PAS domain S-box-containing protein